MIPIIDYDQRTIFVPMAEIATAKTRFNREMDAGVNAVILQNNNGFSNGDYIVIGELGSENSQIVRITDVGVYGRTLYGESIYSVYGDNVDGVEVGINPPLKQYYSNKTSVCRIQYNQVRVYEDSVLVATETLTPDHLVAVSHAVANTKTYKIAFYNSQTEVESPQGMSINGYDRILCTIQHMRKLYGDIQTAGVSFVEKMDLAREEIKQFLLAYGVKFDAFEVLEKLAMPAAHLSCYYVFLELAKEEGDLNWMRKTESYKKFKSSLESVLSNIQDEPLIPKSSFGSAQFIR